MLFLPNRLRRIGRVLRRGVADPRKYFDEADRVSAFRVPNNDMWCRIHQMLGPVNLPGAGKHGLKLRRLAGLDVIRHQHRLRGGLGRTMMRAVRGGTGGQREERPRKQEMCDFHKISAESTKPASAGCLDIEMVGEGAQREVNLVYGVTIQTFLLTASSICSIA